MKKPFFYITLFLFSCFANAYGQPNADEVALKASQAAYYQGRDGRSSAEMVITDSQGRTRQRKMVILRYNIGDTVEQKYYVYFLQPGDVRGMSYIAWKHTGREDDRWLYLPALDLVRRVAASDKRSSFAGTNFLYEDVSGRNPELDTHELLNSSAEVYELKNTPKDAKDVEFSYYKVWIDANNFVPTKAEYYDKTGKLYRTIEALEVKEVQGMPTIVKMKATDLNSGSSTVAQFSDVSYDIGLSDEIFTERYLRNPPRQWIKG